MKLHESAVLKPGKPAARRARGMRRARLAPPKVCTKTPRLARARLPGKISGFAQPDPPRPLAPASQDWGAPVTTSAAPIATTAPAAAEVLDHAEAKRGHSDTLELYLREIGQVKLLTPAEEVALANRVKQGDQQAREQMIKANLRLVVKIARDYAGQGLPLLDLINEGNIGLMKGVERFDPTKGAKLSTYAALWIKQTIRRALSHQSKTIRLPDHVVDKLAHIRRAEMQLHELLDREPTDEEVADHLGLDARRVHTYLDAARAPVSLDAPIAPDEDNRVADIVADPNATAPFARLVRETDIALIKEVLGGLSNRERTIVELRFGLNDDRPRTLEEIGQRFGITRERIRQIQVEALNKLRAKMEERDAARRDDKAKLQAVN